MAQAAELWSRVEGLDEFVPGLRKFLVTLPEFVRAVDLTYAQNEDRIDSAHHSLQMESVERSEADQKLHKLSL